MRHLQFNVDSERHIFEKLFHGSFYFALRVVAIFSFWCLTWCLIFEKLSMAIFVYAQSYCQKCSERKLPKKYFFFHISFWCPTWDANPGFTSNKPTHYLLDYGLEICRKFFLGHSFLNTIHVFPISLLCIKFLYLFVILIQFINFLTI